MTTWYVAQVKPNASHIAKRNLERQGFLVFQPLEKRTITRQGKFSTQTRPFFSGYVFVSYLAANAPWFLVNSTYGVSRLIRFGDSPAPVPEHIIQDLRQACDNESIISVGMGLKAGETVEVTSGPFANFVGQVESLSPNDRAMILLDFMGKQTRVAVNSASLRAASGRAVMRG